jgi:hypothetical protein
MAYTISPPPRVASGKPSSVGSCRSRMTRNSRAGYPTFRWRTLTRLSPGHRRTADQCSCPPWSAGSDMACFADPFGAPFAIIKSTPRSIVTRSANITNPTRAEPAEIFLAIPPKTGSPRHPSPVETDHAAAVPAAHRSRRNPGRTGRRNRPLQRPHARRQPGRSLGQPRAMCSPPGYPHVAPPRRRNPSPEPRSLCCPTLCRDPVPQPIC